MKLRHLSGAFAAVAYALLLQLLAGGCTFTKMQITRADETRVLPPTSVDTVKLYKLGDPAPQPYQVLGAVNARKRTSSLVTKVPTETQIFSALKKQAAGLGADAIVGTYTTFEAYYHGRIGSALAVKFLPLGAQASRDTNSFMVAILPLVNHDAKDSFMSHEDDSVVCTTMQQYLTDRGYYAPIVGGKMPVSSIEALSSLDSASLEQVGGVEMRNVMLLVLEKTAGASLVLVSGSSCLLNSWIYSKNLRKILWDKPVIGSFAQGWIVTAMEGGTRRKALITAAKYLAESLPKRGSVVKLVPKQHK